MERCRPSLCRQPGRNAARHLEHRRQVSRHFGIADLGIGTVRTLGFLPPSTVVVLGFPRAQTDGHTLTVAEEWELDDSFVLAASRDVPQPGRTSVGGDSRVTGNAIVFGSVFDYEFRTFRTDGRPDRVVVRLGTNFVPAVIDLKRGAIGSLGSTGAPVQLEDGRWLTLASWLTNVEDPIAYLRRASAGERVPFQWQHHLDLLDAEAAGSPGESGTIPTVRPSERSTLSGLAAGSTPRCETPFHRCGATG
jgi:hypothetical protein